MGTTIGRPPNVPLTDDIKQEILERILSGEPIATILTALGISRTSFYRWKEHDAALGASIARAQEEAQEAFVDEMESLIPTIDAENYNAIKTQMWARMWIAGKRKPKKYADRPPDVNINATLGVQLVHAIPRPDKPALNAPETPIIDAEVS